MPVLNLPVSMSIVTQVFTPTPCSVATTGLGVGNPVIKNLLLFEHSHEFKIEQ